MKHVFAVALVALLAACASSQRVITAPPVATHAAARPEALDPEGLMLAEVLPAWRAQSPEGRARFEALLLARIDAEVATRVTPSSGLVSTVAPDRAWAIFDALPTQSRRAFARSIFAWLIQRAWAMGHARALIQRSIAEVGPSAYDAIADACDRGDPPYGCTSMMLYTDEAGHDALLARLLPRVRDAFEAANAHPEETFAGPQAPHFQRLDSLLRLVLALERPEPTLQLLLERVVDQTLTPRLRVFALERLHRSDRASVVPTLFAVASRAGDITVRAAVITRLGQMTERASLARFDEIYERTAAGPDDAPVRAALGVVYVYRLREGAIGRLVAWMQRSDMRRAGHVEADAWAHALAQGGSEALSALLAHRAPPARALAILAWSWSPTVDAARIEALVTDRARLDGPSWRAHDVPTVGALAAWALSHRERDPMIRMRGCCV